MLPLRGKVEILNLRKGKKKSYAKGAKIYGRNEYPSCEIVKENEICVAYTVALQIAKVMTINSTYLVKMERELNYGIWYISD